MKNYKYFLIMDTTEPGEPWSIYTTTDKEKAVQFFSEICPRNCTSIELWGTNEEPDIFLTADTIARREF